jgi:murein DD-endopeptidase MepM/ murein hydrolase activator NlpD
VSAAVAQVVEGAPLVAWRPALPLQGSVVSLAVRAGAADSVIAVRGELAGEPLHFERDADEFRALGAVPLAAGRRIAASVVIERAGGASDTVIASLPVRRRRAARERLRAAPEFVQPPDSVAERIEAERELVQELRRRAHDTPRQWRERFVRPRSSAVTSGFGVARVFNGVVRSRHLGVDFAGERGAPVLAANRGVVAFVADLYYSGTTLYIDHGAGLVTAYLHLSRALVAPGDTVARGQPIGQVGASGRVTGPHLHWLAAYGGVTVDPLSLLDPQVAY